MDKVNIIIRSDDLDSSKLWGIISILTNKINELVDDRNKIIENQHGVMKGITKEQCPKS